MAEKMSEADRAQWRTLCRIWRRYRAEGRQLEYALRFVTTPRQEKALKRLRESMA